jgi:hypothetical protein
MKSTSYNSNFSNQKSGEFTSKDCFEGGMSHLKDCITFSKIKVFDHAEQQRQKKNSK